MVAPLILAAYAASNVVKSNKEKQRRLEESKVQLLGPNGPISYDDPLFPELSGKGLVYSKIGNSVTQYKPVVNKGGYEEIEVFSSKSGIFEGNLTQLQIGAKFPNGIPEDDLVSMGHITKTPTEGGQDKTTYVKNPFVESEKSGSENTTVIVGRANKPLMPGQPGYDPAKPNDRPLLYFATPQDAVRSAAVDQNTLTSRLMKVDEAKALGVDVVPGTTTGGFLFQDDKKDEDKKDPRGNPVGTQYVSIYGDDGTIKPEPITLKEYNEMLTKPKVAGGEKEQIFVLDANGVPKYTKSAAQLKEAIDEAAGTQFTYNFKNEDNEVKSIVVATQNTKPVDTLNAINEGIARMPRVSAGSQQIDFSKMSVTEVTKLRNLALTKFINSMTIDPDTGVPQGIAGILTMPSVRFKNTLKFLDTYEYLSQIPGIREQYLRLKGQNDKDAFDKAVAKHALSVSGQPQAVRVGEITETVPIGAAVPDFVATTRTPPEIPVEVSALVPQVFTPAQNESMNQLATLHLGANPDPDAAAGYEMTNITYFKRYKRDRMGKIIGLEADPINPKVNLITELLKEPDQKGIKIAVSFASGDNIGGEDLTFLTQRMNSATNLNYIMTRDILIGLQRPQLGDGVAELVYEENFMRQQNAPTFDDFVGSSTMKTSSAGESVKLFNSMQGTFRLRDGSFINLNSKIGTSIYMPYVFIKQQAGDLLTNIPIIGKMFTSVDAAAGAASNALYGTEGFQSIIDSGNDALIADAAAAANLPVDVYVARERKAQEATRKDFAKHTVGMDYVGDDPQLQKAANIALRNYYRYMVAYTMAAAIQGGTGGRTISDQDVQNILNALAPGSIFISAEAEYQILEAAKQMMIEIRDFHADISSGVPRRVAAALRYAELAGESTRSPYKLTSGRIAQRLRSKLPPEARNPQLDDGNQVAVALTEDDVTADDLKLSAIQDAYVTSTGSSAANLTFEMLEDEFGKDEALKMIQGARGTD